MHSSEDLIILFERCFYQRYQTRLVKGDGEPVYLPKSENRPWHEIQFAHGFFSSALHEIAHWLIAGESRRELVDYGYWYVPDGRNQQQQEQFERVEVKPQALEWVLTRAAGAKFRLSLDNLTGEVGHQSEFKQSVWEQVQAYCTHGLSCRARLFRQALCQFYQTPVRLEAQQFNWQDL